MHTDYAERVWKRLSFGQYEVPSDPLEREMVEILSGFGKNREERFVKLVAKCIQRNRGAAPLKMCING